MRILPSLILLLTACGGGSTHTLRVELAGDLDSLDPGQGFSVTSWQLEQTTCARLLNYADSSDTVLVPEVAAAMPTVSADGLTYTFAVDSRFQFAPPSGAMVTAATMKSSIERAVRINDGAAFDLGPVTNIDASGNQLTITLSDPTPDFLYRIAMPFFCAVPDGTADDTLGQPIPGAGPFSITSISDSEVVLDENPNYRGTRKRGGFDRIVYTRNVGDPATVEAHVLAGSADYAGDGLPADISNVVALKDTQLIVNASPGYRYLALNTTRPLLSDPAVRRGINYALDRNALAAAFGALLATPATQLLPPGVPGHVADNVYPLGGDLAQAKALAGTSARTLVFYTCDADECAAITDTLGQQLAPLGITLEAHVFAIGDLYQHIGTRGEPFDIAFVAWLADYPDPTAFMTPLLDGRAITDQGNIDSSYFDDPTFEAGLDAANALMGDARTQAFSQLDHDTNSGQAPVAVLWDINSLDLFSTRVGCFTFQSTSGIDLLALCRR